MLKRQNLKKEKKVKVTFVVPAELPNAYVAGDFNKWDTSALPLKKRSNGTRSASVELKPGQKYAFRYVSEDGNWFNEEEADGYEVNIHGTENCVVLT